MSGMSNKELPPSLKDKIAAIQQFTDQSKVEGMDRVFYSIEFDTKTGKPRKTVMSATDSKDHLVKR